jgi:hypothetical protein
MVQDGSRWFRMVELLRWFGMVERLWKLLSMFKHASTLNMLREATTARLAPTTGSRVGQPTRRTGGSEGDCPLLAWLLAHIISRPLKYTVYTCIS